MALTLLNSKLEIVSWRATSIANVSAVAYTLWSLLLQRHPVSHITVYSFANPVFGVILSALLLGEGKNLDIPRCLLSLVLVSLGVWIVNGGQKENGEKKPKAA